MSLERHTSAVPIELTHAERQLLCAGVGQWGGPAEVSERLAVALGFADVADFDAETLRLSQALGGDAELSPRDAVRALVATEVVFASDVLGAGVEWETVTGYSDTETISILRDLQGKLVGHYRSLHS